MKYCPNCGAKLSDNSKFCPVCGAKLDDYVVYEKPKVEISNDILCRHCGKAKLLLVDADEDIPLYMCPHCGWYYGDFLGIGKPVYYDSLHLKIGRIIKAEIRMKGYVRVNVKRTKNMEDDAITELSKYLSSDLAGHEITEIRDAIVYMLEEGILELYEEEISEDFSWIGVRFVDSD